MRAASPRQDGAARTDEMLLAFDRQLALPAQHIVPLVLVLLVLPDPRARMQGALSKDERQVSRLGEEGVPRSLAATAVRTRLVASDQRIVLDHGSVARIRRS